MSSDRVMMNSLAQQADLKQVLESKTSAIESHMLSFASDEGFVDQNSIYNACLNKMHCSEKDSKSISVNTMRGAWMFGVPGVHFSLCKGIYGKFKPKDAMGLLMHPHDTGIFNRYTGEFDAELFQVLEDKYAITDKDGTKLISSDKIQQFIEHDSHLNERWADAHILFKKMGQIANGGEFDFFFQRATSRYIDNVGYVTMADLKQWYLNSVVLMQKMQNNEIPVSKPSL